MCVAGLVDIKYINVEKRIEKHIQFFYNRKPYVYTDLKFTFMYI